MLTYKWIWYSIFIILFLWFTVVFIRKLHTNFDIYCFDFLFDVLLFALSSMVFSTKISKNLNFLFSTKIKTVFFLLYKTEFPSLYRNVRCRQRIGTAIQSTRSFGCCRREKYWWTKTNTRFSWIVFGNVVFNRNS